MDARKIYQAAYHNARCVRNLDPRAKIIDLRTDGIVKGRTLEIVVAAYEHRQDLLRERIG